MSWATRFIVEKQVDWKNKERMFEASFMNPDKLEYYSVIRVSGFGWHVVDVGEKKDVVVQATGCKKRTVNTGTGNQCEDNDTMCDRALFVTLDPA